jgi:hypothetical protein
MLGVVFFLFFYLLHHRARKSIETNQIKFTISLFPNCFAPFFNELEFFKFTC